MLSKNSFCPPFFPAGSLGYRNMNPALGTFCRIWASPEVSAQCWGCGNETIVGARWQGVGSLGLERDGQDKQGTRGLKNEWINIQTKVNNVGRSSPGSTGGDVLTLEFTQVPERTFVQPILKHPCFGALERGRLHSSCSGAELC